jgi:hypothetical protein
MAVDEAKRLRDEAARKYRPEEIDLLLIAESPPRAIDRYFYFERVQTQDSLFRYVCKMILGYVPGRAEKPQSLAKLRDQGVFLIDVRQDPGIPHVGHLDSLVERCALLRPKRIILIKASVFDLAYATLRRAGLPVVNERVPFPGSGQQRRFEEAFARALQAQ